MDPSNWSTDPPPAAETRPPSQRGWLWAALVLVVVVAGGAFWYFRRARSAAPQASQALPQPAQDVDAGVAAELDEPLPDGGTARAEEQIQKLSPDPEYAKWAKQPNLVARFAAAISNIADGMSPRTLLGFLAPRGEFKTQEEAGAIFIHPDSYQRYDAMARAVGTVDAAAAARLYHLLRPSLQAAFSQISRRGQNFDRAFSKALHRIADVHLPDGEIKLVPKGAVYAFEDPTLEELPAAEKQLIRMGPQNAKVIQAKCRELLSALALPPP